MRFADGTIGEVSAVDVSTPTAPVITVKPASATGVIPAVAAGSQIGIITNRQNEVNGERKSAYRAPTKYTYPLQIISTTTAISGTAEAVEKWYNRYDGGEDAKAFMKISSTLLTSITNKFLMQCGLSSQQLTLR